MRERAYAIILGAILKAQAVTDVALAFRVADMVMAPDADSDGLDPPDR